jgi:hypothetical protein
MILRRCVIHPRNNNNKGILILPSDSLLLIVLLILASSCFLGVSTDFSGSIVAVSQGRVECLPRSSRQFGYNFRPTTFLQRGTAFRGGEIPSTTKSEIDLSSTMTTYTTQSNANVTATTTSKPKWTWTDARRTLFPIYGENEVTKFLLIGSIKFFIILALTLTRDTKDTLVVTQCGAEAIAFLKVRVVQLDNLQAMYLVQILCVRILTES